MFPRDYDDVRKKRQPDWGKQYAMAILQWHRGQYNTNNQPFAKNRNRLLYANAAQWKQDQQKPTDIAKDNDNRTLPGSSYRNLAIIPTILDALVGKIMKQKLKPTVTMIDQMSMDLRLDFEAQLRQLMEYQRNGAEVGQLASQYGINPEEIPLDMEEYNLAIDLAQPLQDEIKLQLGIDFVFERNDFEVIQKEIISNLLKYDYAMLRYYKVNGERKIRVCDPFNSGTSIFTTEDGRDAYFFYEFRAIPTSDVRAMMMDDPNMTAEDIERVQGSSMTNAVSNGFQIMGNSNPFTTVQQNDICVVLDFEVFSKDQFYRVVKSDGRIFNQWVPAKDIEGKQKVFVSQIQNVYSGMYLLDQNILFNWGAKNNIIREPFPLLEAEYDRTNPANAYGSFLVYQISNEYGFGKTMVDKMMPHADMLQDLWNKIADSNNAYIPQIIKFDLEALASIVIDGKPVSQQKVIDTFFKKGILPTSSDKYKGRNNLSKTEAVDVQTNDGWSGIQFMVNQFAQQMQLMLQICGVPAEVTGGTGEKYQTAKSFTAQIEGSDNVLFPYYFAQKKMIENLSRTIVFDLIIYGLRGFTGNRNFAIEPETMIGKIPNIKIQVLPSEEKIAYLYQEGNKAFDAGLITMVDKIKLFSMLEAGNIKQAEAYFSIKDKRARQRQAESAQADMEMNAAIQQQSTQIATEGKLALEDKKGQDKMMLQQMINQNAITLKLVEAILNTENKTLPLRKIEEVENLLNGNN